MPEPALPISQTAATFPAPCSTTSPPAAAPSRAAATSAWPRKRPVANLWQALLERMDVRGPFVGDSTGALGGLA